MKRFLSSVFFLSIFFLISSASAQCKVSAIVENGKLEIDPEYLYDGFSLTNFKIDAKPRRSQVQFTALKGQRYMLYFCNSGFTEEVKVSVFKEEKEGKQSVDLLGATTLKDQYIELLISKSGNYTIDYTIPVAENAEYGMVKDACMVVLISYKAK
ncbi:MAG TPA: hypothetical protein VF868_11985 [Bacteroidia bacterium]|jgi:hypothetical protein